MRMLFPLLAVLIFSVPCANARSDGLASCGLIHGDGSLRAAQESAAKNPGSGTRIAVSNADDTLAHWSTCANPECHPGGKGVPVSTDQTINNANPSVDGASMLVTVTANSRNFYTDVLWPYKMKGCDDCTQMHTDFSVYPVNSSGVASLEYDAFLFDATRNLNIMWGVQWNQRRKKWQVWDQGSNRWVDTAVTTGPTFGAWNHLQFADHRVIGDTSCSGTECLHYDSMTLNGTTYTLNLTEPAGAIHPGWHSVSGFQFQLDATPVSNGSVTVSEYIDKANMWTN